MSGSVRVARVDEIPPGTGKTVLVGMQPVALFNDAGRIHAYDGVCLHRGGPVGDGDVEDGIVTCPWHGWQYDVATGANVLDTAVCLRRHKVRVEGGAVFVRVAS
jgi:nitrite reductase (NADH) small subunit